MRYIYFSLLCLLFISCDPHESLEAFIVNSSSQYIEINFFSTNFKNLNEQLKFDISEKKLYQEFSSLGSVGFDLSGIDSIYITNTSNEILKVYKEDTTGKNIYNIDDNWSVNEISKNHFVYTYEITEEDLE